MVVQGARQEACQCAARRARPIKARIGREVCGGKAKTAGPVVPGLPQPMPSARWRTGVLNGAAEWPAICNGEGHASANLPPGIPLGAFERRAADVCATQHENRTGHHDIIGHERRHIGYSVRAGAAVPGITGTGSRDTAGSNCGAGSWCCSEPATWSSTARRRELAGWRGNADATRRINRQTSRPRACQRPFIRYVGGGKSAPHNGTNWHA